MKKQIFKKIVSLVIAVGLMLSACPAFSEPERCEGGGMWGHHQDKEYKEKMMERREKLVKELGLTDEQKEKMDRFREEKKTEKQELRQALREKQKELRKELQLYNSNMGKVKSLASEIKRLQGKLIDLRVESISNVKSVLTEEQYKKFTAKTKKYRNNMKKRRYKR